MPSFLNTTFGTAELEILDTVLREWCETHDLLKGDPDAGLAGAILINLFREGNTTVPALRKAASAHKGLASLAPVKQRLNRSSDG
ncbi:MAG: hypothetical protein ACK4N1_05680 [Pseudorhizobium sp.]